MKEEQEIRERLEELEEEQLDEVKRVKDTPESLTGLERKHKIETLQWVLELTGDGVER